MNRFNGLFNFIAPSILTSDDTNLSSVDSNVVDALAPKDSVANITTQLQIVNKYAVCFAYANH
jgi:hypothetical protein